MAIVLAIIFQPKYPSSIVVKDRSLNAFVYFIAVCFTVEWTTSIKARVLLALLEMESDQQFRSYGINAESFQ